MEMVDSDKVTLYRPRGILFWRSKSKYAEGPLREGRREGKWIFWYRSGNKQLEGEYLAGKKTGLWVKWSEAGTKATEGTFAHGKMHGPWTDWHGNGVKALESQWHMGRRQGKWTYWRPDGSLARHEVFDYRVEEDKGYDLQTDLEIIQIVRRAQRENIQRTWAGLVGRHVARLVKPWHIACWVLLFIPAFGLMKAETPWRSAALAAILAFLITSWVAWLVRKKEED